MTLFSSAQSYKSRTIGHMKVKSEYHDSNSVINGVLMILQHLSLNAMKL